LIFAATRLPGAWREIPDYMNYPILKRLSLA
jgi:hypothetical protein